MNKKQIAIAEDKLLDIEIALTLNDWMLISCREKRRELHNIAKELEIKKLGLKFEDNHAEIYERRGHREKVNYLGDRRKK